MRIRERAPHLVIVLCSLLGVLGAAIVDLGRRAPGPLSRAHQLDPDLEGGNDCALCHGGWFESMGDACLECHAAIEEHIELERGLHGRLAEVQAERCGTCHSEHHGEGFRMVNAQSFAFSGVANVETFDHGLVGFEMDGKHLELDCTECHEYADAEVPPEGAFRYLGLDSSCASCHEDPHEGSMRQDCANCHLQTDFDTHRFERHEQFFPLFGSHGEANCLDCHEPEGQHSLAAQMAGRSPHGERECADCHDSPHRRGFLRRNAERDGLPTDSGCATCHDPEAFAFLGDAVGIDSQQHALSGFSIDAPHDVAECADCHDPGLESFAERYPGRSADDCAACHESPHGGQFVGDAFSENDCTSCHARQHFDPPAFGLEEHALAAIPLEGAHAELDCHACHQEPGPSVPRVFRGTAQRCEGCHGDAHRGFFADFEAELARAEGGECATCHDTTSFSEVPPGDFDHARFTGFEVAGAHAQNHCESCHRPSPEPDRHGRIFGHVADHFGEVEGCATCHGDPHDGTFDRAGAPRQVDGRRACSRCHGETSFRTLPFGFDHELWTGFALNGRHLQLECSACHEQRPGERLLQAQEVRWPLVPGDACADCHVDPHAGQFGASGAVDCARCHEDALHFSELRFRHDWDSRFPLEGAHAELECSACHKPAPVGDSEVVRYKPLGTECADCHGVNEDVLRRKQRRRR